MSQYREPANIPMDPEVRQRYERFVPEHVQRAVRAAVLAERERCAKIAEEYHCTRRLGCDCSTPHGEEIASKIRSGE